MLEALQLTNVPSVKLIEVINNDMLEQVEFRKLVFVNGNFLVSRNAALKSISIGADVTKGVTMGNVEIADNAALTTIKAGNVVEIEGKLAMNRNIA